MLLRLALGRHRRPTSLGVQYQYVFSAMGVKTPLVRDTYSSGDIVSGDRLYYLTDANTNVTAVVGLSDSTWVVSERYVYDPYGTVTVYSPDWSTVVGSSLTASTVGNTIGFASMSFDAVTGLYNDEARWYSTATNGFITTDPARADLNTYRYCGDMPMDRIDPTGKSAQAWIQVSIGSYLNLWGAGPWGQPFWQARGEIWLR